MMLSAVEKQRYARHLLLPQVAVAGQEKLKQAKVLCIGAGGLGSPVLLYLAAAGIGQLGIVDHDAVELSNLQRQVLFTADDVGKSKAQTAKHKLLALNADISIVCYEMRLTEQNAHEVFSSYDIIVDCTDNFATRYLINDVCVQLKKIVVYASISQFQGQVSVFNPKTGPCYRCLFPQSITMNSILNCAEGGVLGVLPGMIGTLQAAEVIKVILDIGESLVGRLLIFDVLTMKIETLKINKDPECLMCLEGKVVMQDNVEEIDVATFKQMIEDKVDFVLLDVRNPDEYAVSHMNGKLIPLPELAMHLADLDKEQLYVVHCKAGGRSFQAMQFMKSQGFKHVVNLRGGILAWEKSNLV